MIARFITWWKARRDRAELQTYNRGYRDAACRLLRGEQTHYITDRARFLKDPDLKAGMLDAVRDFRKVKR